LPVKPVRLVLISALAGLAITAAQAFTIDWTTNGEWRVLSSDAPLMVDDWDALRARVLAAYGLDDVPELPFAEVGPLGSPGPEVFGSRAANFEILSLMRPPEDPAILSDLADLFEDIEPSDVRDFDEGLVFEVMDVGAGRREVTVYFFASADSAPPQDPAQGITRQILEVMPADSQQVIAPPDTVGGGLHVITTSTPPEDLLDAFRELFRLLELDMFELERDGAAGLIVTSAHYTVSIFLEPVAVGNGTSVLLAVSPR
jgi:hypothetical protein